MSGKNEELREDRAEFFGNFMKRESAAESSPFFASEKPDSSVWRESRVRAVINSESKRI